MVNPEQRNNRLIPLTPKELTTYSSLVRRGLDLAKNIPSLTKDGVDLMWVDDEPDMQKYSKKVLLERKYNVVMFSIDPDRLDAFNQHDYEQIIADVLLELKKNKYGMLIFGFNKIIFWLDFTQQVKKLGLQIKLITFDRWTDKIHRELLRPIWLKSEYLAVKKEAGTLGCIFHEQDAEAVLEKRSDYIYARLYRESCFLTGTIQEILNLRNNRLENTLTSLLWLDDCTEPIFWDCRKSFCRQSGCKVTISENKLDSMKALRGNAYDIFIIQMRKSDDVMELLRWARKQMPQLTIIIFPGSLELSLERQEQELRRLNLEYLTFKKEVEMLGCFVCDQELWYPDVDCFETKWSPDKVLATIDQVLQNG